MVSNQIFALVQQDLGLALEQSVIRLITYIKGDYDVEVTWFEYSKAYVKSCSVWKELPTIQMTCRGRKSKFSN
jgi:hypothetical protein